MSSKGSVCSLESAHARLREIDVKPKDLDRVIGLIGDVDVETGCREWQGYVGDNGYGYARIGGRKGPLVLAHRVVFALLAGEIPTGLTLDHLCRNRACVEITHLEAVTNQENILRGESPAAKHAKKTRCPSGHDYTPENTYKKDGRRYCRACNRERARRRAAK